MFVVAIAAFFCFCCLPGTQADTCYTSSALNFTSQQGGLYVNGNRLKLKGTSWFGFETSVNAPHGLWAKSYTFFLDFLANNGFNAIRV
jgi:aryl-phospho-beta-D-glucosidase BglC (GH1 family)